MARVRWPAARIAEPARMAARVAETVHGRAAGAGRLMVAIAGPPGAGKSTFSEALLDALSQLGNNPVVVPMDGFHLDNRILDARGLRPRKGAPETFDYFGFETTLRRIRSGEKDVVVPVFDRTADLARAGAEIVSADADVILVEGNYLLLDEAPWSGLAPLFDLSLFIEVPREELERRLVRRWIDHDHTPEQARTRALSNDIPNAERVLASRRPADIVL